MATRNMTGTIQMRRDTAANWATKNPVLAAGEFGFDTTAGLVKIGNGSTAWNSLPFIVNTTLMSLPLESASWDQIARLSSLGIANAFFKIGDKKTIQLSTSEQITLTILGFNHDDLQSGGKAGITFGMENCLATQYRMNETNTNVGSWGSTEMRNTTMATLFSQLPADLQTAIKTVIKKSSAGNLGTNIVTSADKLFLFSEVEVDATTTSPLSGEGVQYEYWRTVKDGKVAANRIKYLSNGTGAAVIWWLRSPYPASAAYFYTFNTSGTLSTSSASLTRGVSVGFCI